MIIFSSDAASMFRFDITLENYFKIWALSLATLIVGLPPRLTSFEKVGSTVKISLKEKKVFLVKEHYS